MKSASILALATLFGSGILAAACNQPEAAATQTDRTPIPLDASTTPGSAQSDYDPNVAAGALRSQGTASTAQAPDGTISVDALKPKDGDEVAVMETDKGRIVLMFFPDKAPKHVANFKKLATSGFYAGTKFHRIIPGFMIQGGDPNTKTSDRSTWGQGGPGYQVKAEFNNIHHAKGVLSMARSQDPDSAGSQFFIMVGDAPSLDHQYTAFGKVVEGQDVADAIVAMPADGDQAVDPVAIKSIKIEKWPVK